MGLVSWDNNIVKYALEGLDYKEIGIIGDFEEMEK